MAIPPAGRARRPSGRSSRVVVGPTVPRPRRTERCPSQRGPEPVRRRRRELTGIGDHLETEGHLPGKSLRCRGSGRHARRSFEQRPSSWSAMAASRSWRAHAATAPQPRRCATEPVRRRSRRASGGGVTAAEREELRRLRRENRSRSRSGDPEKAATISAKETDRIRSCCSCSWRKSRRSAPSHASPACWAGPPSGYRAGRCRGHRPEPGVTPNGRRASSGGTSPAGASAARRGSPPS